MFFIMGGETLIVALAALFGFPEFEKSFGHVPWHGLNFMDTVFPLFLFLAGVSFPFSAAKSRERGLSPGAIGLRALKRGLVLFAFGLAYNGFLRNLDFAHFRVWSVLGRIGLAWMVAVWIYLALGVRSRIAVAAAILVGVTLLTRFVIAPDAAALASSLGDAAAAADPFSAVGNLGCWLDRTLSAGHCYNNSPVFDPEGFAGILPAVVTAMLGMFAGDLLRREGRSGGRKTADLLFLGAALAALGGAWSFAFPINKALWSPSFTLVVGGYSALMLALFHWAIDVRGWTRGAFFFKVIGMNSITVYMLQSVVDMNGATKFFLGGLADALGPALGAVVLSCGYIALCWLAMWFLYRKQTFLKV